MARKSRVEAENAPNQHASESPPDASEDGGNFFRRFSESRLSDVAPASPSQQSLDLDQGQHMPHLLCSYCPAGYPGQIVNCAWLIMVW